MPQLLLTPKLISAAKVVYADGKGDFGEDPADAEYILLLKRVCHGVELEPPVVSLQFVKRLRRWLSEIPETKREGFSAIGVDSLLEGSSVYIEKKPERAPSKEYQERMARLRAAAEAREYAKLVSDVAGPVVCYMP